MSRSDRDRHRAEYAHDNAVAYRKAQTAAGLFLRADEVASLQYHLRRDRAGVRVTWPGM